MPPLPSYPCFPDQHVPATYDQSNIHSEFHPASHPHSLSEPRHPSSVRDRLGPRHTSENGAEQTSLRSVHERLNFDSGMQPSHPAAPRCDVYEEPVPLYDGDGLQDATGVDDSQDYGYLAPYNPELSGGDTDWNHRQEEKYHRPEFGGYGGGMEGGQGYGYDYPGHDQTYYEEEEQWEAPEDYTEYSRSMQPVNEEVTDPVSVPVSVPRPVSRMSHRLGRGDPAGPAASGGYIFGCTQSTYKECFTRELFGVQQRHLKEVQKLRAGSKLFLFHFQKKVLYGVFEAEGAGGRNLVPEAFDGKFSAQVPVPFFYPELLLCCDFE